MPVVHNQSSRTRDSGDPILRFLKTFQKVEDLQLFALSQHPKLDIQEAVAHADGSISLRDLQSGAELLSKRILSSQVSSMVSPAGSNVIMIASDNQPFISCVDAGTLKVLAKFDAGRGNIIGMKIDDHAKRLQILGSQGAVRIWQFAAP